MSLVFIFAIVNMVVAYGYLMIVLKRLRKVLSTAAWFFIMGGFVCLFFLSLIVLLAMLNRPLLIEHNWLLLTYRWLLVAFIVLHSNAFALGFALYRRDVARELQKYKESSADDGRIDS